MVEVVNFAMKGVDNEAFKDPTVDLQTAMIATLILIIAGALAGWLPARKANSRGVGRVATCSESLENKAY